MTKSGFVTWQQAEDAMLEVMEWVMAMPDRERPWLTAGSRSAWPQIIRDMQSDYGDPEARPSARLSRRMVDRCDAMLLGERAAMNAIALDHRRLVGRVLVMQLRPGAEGFGWERIWLLEGGRKCGVTSDALRMRYNRAVGAVARRMDALGLGLGAE